MGLAVQDSWISEASSKVGVNLVSHVNGQAVGPCPLCRTGSDRFVVFVEGNYWCRQCGDKGWWAETKPTAEQIQAVKDERLKTNRSMVSRMNSCRDWIWYHNNVSKAMHLWETDHHISPRDVNKWGLGFCTRPPLAPEQESLTIPVFYKGKLVDIRHRIIGGSDGDKYRSHLKGLIPPFFNMDSARFGDEVFVVEGEKKAIIMESIGIKPCISFPGIGFKDIVPAVMLRDVPPKSLITFIPDPGTEAVIEEICRLLRKEDRKSYIVDVFEKPDDFLLEYGVQAIQDAIRMKRPV